MVNVEDTAFISRDGILEKVFITKTNKERLSDSFRNLTSTMSFEFTSAHAEVWSLWCGLDKEPSRKEIKLAERMARILKDFEARQLEVDEGEQLEVVEEQGED
ncbi:unnamed protein product [Heligmosomoides polygyrus]|uniref:RNase H domain-containing protein n=1 Tax=Heligmosomoides polygyrus TaxID=6339 RepID=A0A183FIU5_HELPZ|nr:unnamed protein product [Heligmosomoides polygyrus]